MHEYASLGAWVQRRRKALDLTQAELAERVGCALGTLRKIETDERRPSKQIAARLVAEVTGRPAEERLQAFLRAKQTLLLLDNFEQVLGAAPLVAELLAAAPGLKVLVTSRAVLHLYGEHEFAAPPLGLPPALKAAEGAEAGAARNARLNALAPSALSAADLTQYDAVKLFIARAQAAKAGFTISNDDTPAVAEICF